MGKKLWEASKNKKTNSNLYAYEKFISKKFNLKLDRNYKKILNWSIKNSGKFWSSIWDYCKVTGYVVTFTERFIHYINFLTG